MKILALTTIILSLTSGNSNLEISQKCNKAFEYKQNKESLFVFDSRRFDKPVTIHEDCNCQDAISILTIRSILGDVEDMDDFYPGIEDVYRSNKCDQKSR